MRTVTSFQRLKENNEKIAMLTIIPPHRFLIKLRLTGF